MTGKDFTDSSTIEPFTIVDIGKQDLDFRKVRRGGEHPQTVIISVAARGEIRDGALEDTDQILCFVSGHGKADLIGQTHPVGAGEERLTPNTVHTPPEHAAGASHRSSGPGERRDPVLPGFLRSPP
ncbi:cupin domain-containing protein [Paeniglutamicibacter antarcticus]|uniref:Cupin domain-containing protein n=1 Tax=Paeniglutamicibacter antarcticus TaxID=494023 RepID=A0ABP9TUM8_9MICC